MATIPPVNMGALKVTFPANLPRNEKDLICMLLAGRLKDLWNGKLICAQLALDDLIKSTTGVSGLEALRGSLLKAKVSLDKLRQASGYDKILGGVNAALGQVSNVFSLGGLCPSPVQAPKIPDILGQLNQNLFGQANNILNALAQASNPKVCLGGGPKGFGIDWSNVTGDLKNLKNAINQFKNNPANYTNTIAAFNSNLKTQEKRLNAEVKRLGKNLADPLGINEKKNTVGSLRHAKAISDGIPVKDKNGITYANPLRMMVSGEVDAVVARTDPQYTSPVMYKTYPVYDYCGDLTGYERRIVTGDEDYMGWDTVFTENNTASGTDLPAAGFAEYDYTLVEESTGLEVKNSAGAKASITLERGKHYRIKVAVSTLTFKMQYMDAPWHDGISATADPEYGSGFDIIHATDATVFDNKIVEIDWAVSIERPTTPDLLSITVSNGQQIAVAVTGITAIPAEDKTYDTNNIVRKSITFTNSQLHTYDSTSVWEEQQDTSKQYNITSTAAGIHNFSAGTSSVSYAAGYSIIDDNETLDETGSAIEGNKILKFVQPYNSEFIVSKIYYSEVDGLDISQYSAFKTTNLSDEEQGYVLLSSLKFTKPVEFLNDTKLPFVDYKEFMLTLADGTKLINTEQIQVELVSPTLMKVHLSENRTALTSPGEFILSFECTIDAADPDRTYQTTNPKLSAIHAQFKGSNFEFEQTITLNN